jgi:ABC-2 type transport system permease protein
MIATIISYEVKSRFKHWSIFLLYGLLIFQGIWYTKGTFDYYVNEDLLMNAPAIFYKNLAGSGILMIIIVAAITGPVLFKDIQYKTGQWLFTKPIQEKKFFLGRFLSAFSINSLIALGYVIGMLLVPYSGIGEPHRFGNAPIGQLLHGYFFLLLPNLLLLTSLVFFSLVYFKKMSVGYMAVIITVVLFLLMQTTAENSEATPLLMLGDSFGYVAVDHAIEFMTVQDRNYGYLKFTEYLLGNRILWTSFSLLLIGLAYKRFSFKDFINSPNHQSIPSIKAKDGEFQLKTSNFTIQSEKNFSLLASTQRLFSLSILEFKNVVRPSIFKVILGIVILMNILQNLLWNASYYLGSTEPLTFTMTQFRLTYGIFIMILLMVLTGELLFKDRTLNFWQISDALPVPVWTVPLSRYLAMIAVSFILALTFMLTGIFSQIIQGGFYLIYWKLYFYDIMGFNWGWLTYVLQVSMVFFIAGLTKKRILTHIISVGILFWTILSFELGLAEQTIYAYAAVPGLEDYSEMSGYGIWTESARWYFFMWSFLAFSFLLAGIWFWQRGSNENWWRQFSLFNPQLTLSGKIVLLLIIIGFLVTRNHIIEEVNAKGNFVSSGKEENEKAEYEKKYSQLKNIIHPKYKRVDLKFEFYPKERKAIYEANIQLTNLSSTDRLYLNWEEFIEVQEIFLGNESLLTDTIDEELKITSYIIPQSYQKNKFFSIKIKAVKQYSGFTQSGANPQPDLMFNGSFGNIKNFLPTIGYNYERELKENRKRIENSLPKLKSRKSPIDDQLSLNQDAHSPDAEWVTGSMEISTTEDQEIIGTGILIKKWKKEGRNYYHFEIRDPQPFIWYLGSSCYNSNKISIGGINIEIYYDPKHPFNLSLYEKVASKTIAFVQENLGAFPHTQLRIYEIPYYQEAYYSFPAGIAISEKEGWYSKVDKLSDRAYVYQTIASQIINQWIDSNIKIANVQGADMLKIALPEALALFFIDEELGNEALEIILKKKKDRYAKDKNNEANVEPPLLYADGVDYLERNKGALVIHQTIRELGTKEFTQALISWSRNKKEYGIFKELVEVLLKKGAINHYEN